MERQGQRLSADGVGIDATTESLRLAKHPVAVARGGLLKAVPLG